MHNSERGNTGNDRGVHASTVKDILLSRTSLVVIGSILCVFAVLVIGVIVLSHSEYVLGRVTMLSVFFLFVSTSLAEKSIESRVKEKPWSELAARTGLTYKQGKLWLGHPARVTGTYRNRTLSLYTYKMGRGHPFTRIELVLNNPTNALLRLRGPYDPAEIGSDEAFGQMFGRGNLYHIGKERFFIRSQPQSFAASLFGTTGQRHGPLRYRLLKLQRIANIELDGHRLHFEQFGALTDIDYLETVFELLSDLAEALESPAAEETRDLPVLH